MNIRILGWSIVIATIIFWLLFGKVAFANDITIQDEVSTSSGTVVVVLCIDKLQWVLVENRVGGVDIKQVGDGIGGAYRKCRN